MEELMTITIIALGLSLGAMVLVVLMGKVILDQLNTHNEVIQNNIQSRLEHLEMIASLDSIVQKLIKDQHKVYEILKGVTTLGESTANRLDIMDTELQETVAQVEALLINQRDLNVNHL